MWFYLYFDNFFSQSDERALKLSLCVLSIIKFVWKEFNPSKELLSLIKCEKGFRRFNFSKIYIWITGLLAYITNHTVYFSQTFFFLHGTNLRIIVVEKLLTSDNLFDHTHGVFGLILLYRQIDIYESSFFL